MRKQQILDQDRSPNLRFLQLKYSVQNDQVSSLENDTELARVTLPS